MNGQTANMIQVLSIAIVVFPMIVIVVWKWVLS